MDRGRVEKRVAQTGRCHNAYPSKLSPGVALALKKSHSKQDRNTDVTIEKSIPYASPIHLLPFQELEFRVCEDDKRA